MVEKGMLIGRKSKVFEKLCELIALAYSRIHISIIFIVALLIKVNFLLGYLGLLWRPSDLDVEQCVLLTPDLRY